MRLFYGTFSNFLLDILLAGLKMGTGRYSASGVSVSAIGFGAWVGMLCSVSPFSIRRECSVKSVFSRNE